MPGKQLVRGCYAVAWVGVEPTTSELHGIILYTEPRRPTQTTTGARYPIDIEGLKG